MKGLALKGALAMTGAIAGVTEPIFAQAAGFEPLPPWASMGVAGASLIVVLIVVSRVIPRAVERMGEAVEKAAETNSQSQGELKDSIEGMRDDQNRYQESHLAFLREQLRRDTKGLGS